MEYLTWYNATQAKNGNEEIIEEMYGGSDSEVETEEEEVDHLFNEIEFSTDSGGLEALEAQVEVIEDGKSFQEAAVEEQYSLVYSIFETVVWGATAPFSYIYETLSNVFYDGKNPCKQAKYACVLQEIMSAIPDSIKILTFNEPHCLTPLQEYLRQIVLLLNRPDDEFDDGKRTKHRDFLKLYREAINSKAYESEYMDAHSKDIAALNDIAAAIYNVRLYSFLASVVCGVIEKGYGSDHSVDIMDLTLIEQREAIINLPQADKAPLYVLWYNCMKGHFGIWFDPHLMGNIPHILFDLQYGDQITRFIRTGTPTIDEKDPELTWGFRTRMAPEFLAFLRHCYDSDKKILYFNLQSAVGGAESHRSKLLKETFEDEGLKNSIFMLPHDTKYYNQSGKWEDFKNAETFKKSVVNHLIEDPNFWIPVEYQSDEDFLEELHSMMDEIHEDIFFKEETLSQEERQDFLDIAFSQFIFVCIKYMEPDIVIPCCKDALDRAGVRTFIFMYLMMLYTNQLDRDSKRKLMVTTFGPPFLMKKQELIDERFERLSRCHERLSNERVMENLLIRATRSGLRESVRVLMHPVDEQVFDMEEGYFETELEE